MLTGERIRELLRPFEISLSDHQVAQVLTYLELLLRWNAKINLTAIRSAEECITRHFGESLFLAEKLKLGGRLLDVGSGAGFPGLALKIAFPELSVTLLEPVTKKRAFLKEVCRVCGMEQVEVRSERLEDFVEQKPVPLYDTATARAVGQLGRLVPMACRSLLTNGRLCLWLSNDQARGLSQYGSLVEWQTRLALPLSLKREIWIGVKIAPPTNG